MVFTHKVGMKAPWSKLVRNLLGLVLLLNLCMFTSITRPSRLRTSVDQGAFILTLWVKTIGKKIKFKMSLFVLPPPDPPFMFIVIWLLKYFIFCLFFIKDSGYGNNGSPLMDECSSLGVILKCSLPSPGLSSSQDCVEVALILSKCFLCHW